MESNGTTRHSQRNEPLAVVGMACRLPGGVKDIPSFWDLLCQGRSGITEVPRDRWNRDRFYHPDTAVPLRMHSQWGGFIDELDDFDARFWGISPREAARMDPQQRWLLEVAWEAVEDAGIPPSRLAGTNTGVFIGIASSDYAQIQMTNHEGLDVHSNSGNTLSIAANRISYALDLKGPSISVDTACSSSLVAVSLACHSIWDGTCDAALVGGVNAVIVPSTTMAFSKATMLSPDGKCFAFDSRANGYVRGEGAGVLCIKPLSRALAHGDPVYAVIRAAVANQDGKTSSMTVPGVEAQKAMLELAYKEAGIPPHRVLYVEAHGTGTPLGDPIEATALGTVLSRGRSEGTTCLIGSVKTNIGHLEAGSGIAGLMKAILVLDRGQVPPNLNFHSPNPKIPLAKLRLEVPTSLRPLPAANGHVPVTAVNSFGFGGTNAHVVLEGRSQVEKLASDGPSPVPAQRPFLLPISARDDVALRNNVRAFLRVLRDDPPPLADLCYSAGVRREHHPQRLAVVGTTADEIRDRLSAWLGNPEGSPGVVCGERSATTGPLAFVFTGQGPQWWGMGQQLLQREPLVRDTVARIDGHFSKYADWSLLQEMTRGESDSRMDQTDIAQPAIFALQVALAELLRSWGITPHLVVGHSVGEMAAAYVAGIYDLEDAVRIAYHRSRLQHTTRGRGRMLATALSAAQARAMLGHDSPQVHISAINSPSLVTLSGDREPLERIATRLEASHIFLKWLGIDYAFHSDQMDSIQDELLQCLADIRPRPGSIPFVSTVTGNVLPGEELHAEYWWRNVRLPVLFAPAVNTLVERGCGALLEVGPHPSLRSSLEDCLAAQNHQARIFHTLRTSRDESEEMLNNVAGLHVWGADVAWAALNQSNGHFVRTPRYQWTHEKFWLEAPVANQNRLADTVHPLLGIRVQAVEPTWEFVLDPRLFPYVNDHKLWDSVVFPAAGFAEMGLALARQLFPEHPHAVEDLRMQQALFAFEDKLTMVRVVFTEADKTYRVYSATDQRQEWELHAQGRLTPLLTAIPESVDLDRLQQQLPHFMDHDSYYADLIAAGYGFGPNFRQVQDVWREPGEALARIVVPSELESGPPAYCFHPAVLDACFQTFRAVRDLPVPETGSYLFLPSGIGRIRVFVDRPPRHLWARATQTHDDGPSLVCNILVYDDQGTPVAEILEFRVDPVEQKTTGDDLGNCLYQFRWEPCRLRGIGHQGSCNLATTDAMVAAAAAGVPQLYEEYGLGNYSRDFLPRSERISCQYIQNAFLKLGWRMAPGDTFTLVDFVRQLGIIRQHHRVARIQLKALQDAGILHEVGPDRWTVVKEPRYSDPKPQLAQLEADYPRLAGSEIALSKMNGEAADKILTGEVNATELLFPGGSSRLVGQFYVDGLDFPAQNRLIPLAVAKAIEKLPPRRTLRVLEIGAGTGSLTREVLPILPPDRTEYLFTDIGPAFVTAAKGLFAKYPFVDYKPFDLEKPAAEQGLAPHGYDLVLASAVLHATEDLRRTLRNIVSCLTHEGLLIFLEPIHRRNVTDIIFGGLPGWWKFTDTDLRPDHALMPRGKWERLLSECGFRDVRSVISAPTESESEQAILIAIAPDGAGESSQDSASPVAAQAMDAVATNASTPIPPAAHLVFADLSGLADQVIAKLAARGDRAIRIDPTTLEVSRARSSTEGATLPTADATAEDAVVRAIQEAGPLSTVIHCWCLDQPPADQLTVECLTQAQHTGVLTALRIIRTLSRQETDSPPRVYFVTRGVQEVVEGDLCSGLSSAPVVGFARVANAEHASFRCTVIDLACEPSPHEIEDVFQELTQGDKELEIAFRQGRRYVNRLRRSDPSEWPRRTVPAEDPQRRLIPFRLQVDKPGVLDHLSLNETCRPEPGPDEVEVRVMAGGINFRDVMKALGIYPGNPPDRKWFGDDFAGRVERVGNRVKNFQPGDSVAGIAPYCFRSFALTDARTVFTMPPGMSWSGAATLPTVFLTAHYALESLAHLQAGERILIHAAAGGVGQAAIQIARRLGLQIFATAGSPPKRKLLHDLGVQHVLDSRTLDFADQLLALTDGQGVDAVLNSLSGPFISKSLSVLAPFGRFLEIGKVDIYNNSRLGLEALKHNISYFVIDLAECLIRRPALVARMLSALAERFHAGEYQPLSYQEFPVTDVADAFRQMAQGQHMGKNVLTFDVTPIPIGPCTMDGHLFRPAASYLITGGAGGLGLEVAKWMARHGARHLVLMSRSGPRDEHDQVAIDTLRADGVQVLDARGDVTRPDDVRRVVQRVRDSMPVLRGVIHGAMVLDDGFITDLQDEPFQRVLNPKMMGAWNLHVETRDMPLEHFICFSSFSAVAGGAKQSNYNAGNLFLDSLAHYRRRLGLPALTINWGGIAGAGFVHRNQKITEYFQKIGFQSFSVEDALSVMRLALQYDQPQIAVARVDWQSMERFSPFVAGANMFAPLTRENARDGSSASSRPMILAASGEERGDLVRTLLTEQLAAVCGIDAAKVNPDTSIMKLGLDSLMAIELINRVEGKLGLVVPMGKVLGGPTLRELSETVLQLLAYSADDPGAVERSASTESGPGSWSEVTTADLARLPLSEAQQTHWFQNRLEPQHSNIVAITVALHPPVDGEALRRSLLRLAQQYPQLAATFSDESGEPIQSLARASADGTRSPACLPDFASHAITHMSERDLARLLADRAQRPFDLEQGPAARVEIFHRDHQPTVLLFVAHRIVADNASMAVWVRELIAGCLDVPCGRSEVKPLVDDAFANYVMWERSFVQSEAGQASRSYWKDRLADLPAPLNLRAGFSRSSGDGLGETHRWFRLDSQLSHRLFLLAAEHEVKPAIILLSAWELLLHRRCEQDDLLVACLMNGRESADLRTVTGSLARWVPLRSRQRESRTFADWLRGNQSQWADAERHARGSLDPLLQSAAERREAGRSILCQAGFSMVRDALIDEPGVSALLTGLPGQRLRLGPVIVEGLEGSPPTTPWEICLTVEETNGSFLGCWQQSARVASSSEHVSLALLHEAFVAVLQEVVADPFVEFSPQGCATTLPTAPPVPPFVAARSETEHLVSRLWQDLLGSIAVGMRDDFFALGGHSLKLALLAARLRRMFHVDVPLPELIASPTVEQMAAYIDGHRHAHSPPVVDLTQLAFADDALLDPAIQPPAEACQRRSVDRILLTGATGFLGAFLLDELLRQTDAEVYCLIRGGSRERALRRLFQNLEKYDLDPISVADRIIPVPGDLSQPELGLAPEDFDQLAREIDVIYHNGAVLNFAYTYPVLRESNVRGTHEILRLAMRHHLKPTHYVSTVAVLASSHRSAFDLVTEADRLPSFSSLRDAYSQTKWMSEQLIAVARERGLPVTIYRPGGITGHSQTGICNVGDLIHVMALGCYQLGTLPHLDLEFNLAPVDFVAAALVALSRRPGLLGKTFHLVNPEPLPLDAFVEWVQRSDLPLERMPYEHWRAQVSELVATVPSDVFGLLTKFFMPGVISGDMQDAIPQVLRLRYDCRQTLAALADSGLSCPRMNESLLSRYLAQLRQFGLVQEERAAVSSSALRKPVAR